MSEKTRVDFSPEDLAAMALEDKCSMDAEHHSASSSPAKSAEGVFAEDDYLDGGRGWLVVLGCVIFAATTLGWAYVLDLYTIPQCNHIDSVFLVASGCCRVGQAREHCGQQSLTLSLCLLFDTHSAAGLGRCADLLPGAYLPQHFWNGFEYSGQYFWHGGQGVICENISLRLNAIRS